MQAALAALFWFFYPLPRKRLKKAQAGMWQFPPTGSQRDKKSPCAVPDFAPWCQGGQARSRGGLIAIADAGVGTAAALLVGWRCLCWEKEE